MFTPPTPVLSLRSDRSPSLSSQPRPPRRVSRQASRAGECCSAPSLRAGVSPLCAPHPCGCALLRGSEASPSATHSLRPRRGSSVWTPFLLHGSLPLVQFSSLFVSVFSFVLPRYVWIFLPFGRSEVFCQHSVGFSVGAVPRVDVFLMYLWGGR